MQLDYVVEVVGRLPKNVKHGTNVKASMQKKLTLDDSCVSY